MFLQMNSHRVQPISNVSTPPIHFLKFHPSYLISLQFTASWCPPCRKMVPHLTELQKKFPNVKMIGVSEENQSQFTRFVFTPEAGYDFTAVVDSCGALDAYRSKYKISGIPHCIVIEKGRVVFSGHPAEPGFDSLIAAISERN